MKLRKPYASAYKHSNKYGSSWAYKGKGPVYGGPGKLTAVRHARISGKGRFGKRPPSLTAECVGPAIDSEDSGFGCDFHSSESQLSWSNDDTKLGGGATTNSTNSVQQPIFSLTSRTLSNSNLNSNSSSQITTTSSPQTTSASFTIPQFSTSSPEKQFLTNLLHEHLAQEDAIDQFEGPYYTTIASTTTTSPSVTTPLTLPDSGISTFTPCTTSAIAIAPATTVAPPQQTKLLLIVPGPANSGTANISQPLDFAQVFGKLSSATPTTTAQLVNNVVVNELFQTKSVVARLSSSEEQKQDQHQQQQLTCDSQLIKIEQGVNKNMQLPPEIHNDGSNEINNFDAFALKNDGLSKTAGVESNSRTDTAPTPLSPVAAPPQLILPPCTTSSFSNLTEILIESSREALQLEGAESNGGHQETILPHDENSAGDPVVVTTIADPMVILSQAVTLQKELYEEPALDGIPITAKSANTINGFGFAKSISANSGTISTNVKNLVDPHLPSPTTLVVLPQQPQQPIENPPQPMKLMQLTENVKMSPDSTNRGLGTTGALSFSGHAISSHHNHIPQSPTVTPIGGTSTTSPSSAAPSPIPMKRSRFSFPHPAATKGLKLRNQNHNQNYLPTRSVGKRLPPGTTPTLTSNLSPFARDGRAQLQIVSQPEEQHRARYQTEGSRGAIKDRKGNGFPTVKLVGYDKPATLQIFIGTDQGKVSPHMFYQACKVTGKSSTPCIEKKVEGTILIEIEFEPSKEMVISCDCVGILKERNVDVEQRFPFHHASQSRKKSTKCRMIFRTTIINGDGMEETLQAASLPILCTQPPGVPEICKQSIMECPAKGGLELFIIGKNFLKDTRVIFQHEDMEGNILWESNSEPLKDYLQQNHLICAVPPFKEEKIMEPVECKVLVVSGGKHSETHRFTYLPEIITAHLGPAISSCVPNSPTQQQAPPVIQATLVPQIPGGQGLVPVDIQTLAVNSIIPNRDCGLVPVVTTSPSEAMSPVSPDGSMVSSMSQPSPPAPTTPVTVAMNPLTTIGFQNGSMISTPVTTADGTSAVVNSFQSVLQQAVQQQNSQAESKPVVSLLEKASELMESMKSSTATTTFSSLALPSEKPPVANSIPIDLQFPTQDLPTSEAAAITTVNNPFQQNEPQIPCVTIPQMMSGMGMNGTISAGATSPPVITTTVPVSSPQQQSPTTATTANEMVIAGSPPAPAPVSTLSVVDCLGQAIIKAEAPPTITNNLRLTMSNNIAAAAAVVSAHRAAGAPPTTVMGMLGGPDMQPHQGTLANALSQMSDNDLINYINPNCFEGPLL